jgi:hypothetical protein
MDAKPEDKVPKLEGRLKEMRRPLRLRRSPNSIE